jgi:predicted DNA-binding transcriptional regulator AlpA
MTKPKQQPSMQPGYISTAETAVMLGLEDTIYGRQYLSLIARHVHGFPKSIGLGQNKTMAYNKKEITDWLKNNQVKQALKTARQIATGRTPNSSPIDDLQAQRIKLLRQPSIAKKRSQVNIFKNSEVQPKTLRIRFV